MSVRLIQWAFQSASVRSKADLLVLLVLCEEDRDRGRGTWLSLETIASRARTSTRGVQNSLRKLEAGDLVTATHRPGKTTVYHVSTPVAECTPVAGCTPVAQLRDPCSPATKTPVAQVHPNRKEPSRTVRSAQAPTSTDFSKYDEGVIG